MIRGNARHARHLSGGRTAWSWRQPLGSLASGRLRVTLVALLAVAVCAAGGAFAITYSSQPTPPPDQKGVGTWSFTGVRQALAESGAKWYYDWSASPGDITTPLGVKFVPMIWGPTEVTPEKLSQAKSEGHILLGFNEPDNTSQADMSVEQALDLWPQLMATGMALGSPAVTSGAATPGGWLDQFMAGAKARGYRVNFIAVHWYGSSFDTPTAVQQLQSYLQSVYDRYHLPIWLTEFALVNFEGSTPVYPTPAQQASFLAAATSMLAGQSYVHRYAWFALPASDQSGTAGLFAAGPVATEVGSAFKSARLPARVR